MTYTVKVGEYLSDLAGIYQVVAFNEKEFCTVVELIFPDDSDLDYYEPVRELYLTREELKKLVKWTTGKDYNIRSEFE